VPPGRRRRMIVSGLRCAGMRALILAVAGAVAVAGCSAGSGAAGTTRIDYGTPAATIAARLGVCAHPEHFAATSVRCRFADGQIVLVSSIAGPADQQLELPAARANDFCELVGHGFGVTGLSYGELKRHVRLNTIVARYDGTFAGGGC
jgi:hypothetical protein